MTWGDLTKEDAHLLTAIQEKAMGPGLDHLDCEDRVVQAMLDLYLVLTDDHIRDGWNREL